MYKIGMLARWSSPIITHYARMAPLVSLTDDFKRKHGDKEQLLNMTQIQNLEKKIKDVLSTTKEPRKPKELKALESRIVDLANRFDHQHAALKSELEASIAAADANKKRFVFNTVTKVTHRMLNSVDEAGINARAHCSFRYAMASFRLLRTHDEAGEPCHTCFPELKR